LQRYHSHINKENLLAGLVVGFFTFLIALLLSLGSEAFIQTVNNFIIALGLLLIIILLGIFFDIIGTAATAAQIAPFNARAAKKIPGAAQAVRLTQNAGQVANFCNDVIGDIAGTLSGAIGAGIVASLVGTFPTLDLVLTGAVMTSLIAALTVGGKAIGKNLAVEYANQIIFRVARIMAYIEGLTGKKLFENKR
jgi:CBS domain containing-hemolysin-like protein